MSDFELTPKFQMESSPAGSSAQSTPDFGAPIDLYKQGLESQGALRLALAVENKAQEMPRAQTEASHLRKSPWAPEKPEAPNPNSPSQKDAPLPIAPNTTLPFVDWWTPKAPDSKPDSTLPAGPTIGEKEPSELERRKGIVPDGKENSLKEYAVSWSKFLKAAGMPDGPIKNLLGELGTQLFMGKFDGQKFADLINKVPAHDQARLDQALQGVNQRLAQDGLKITLSFDKGNRSISEFEIASTDAFPRSSIKVDATGKMTATEVGAQQQQSAIPFWKASMRIAKKAEPAACP